MMNRLVKMAVAVAQIACVGTAFADAAGTIAWNGTSGEWSSPSIWTGGKVPDSTTIASFPGGFSGTITITGDCAAYYLQIKENSKESAITFTGSGKLDAIGSTTSVGKNRHVVIDGPAVTCKMVTLGGDNAICELKSGSLVVPSSQFKFKDGVTGTKLLVSGGRADLCLMNFVSGSDAHILLSGGELAITSSMGTFTGGIYEFTGGTFVWKNATSRFTIPSDVTEFHFGVDRLVLKNGLAAASANTRVVFDKPVVLGALSDWDNDDGDGNLSSILFKDSVELATTDYSDGTTARTIALYDCGMTDAYGTVRVTGVGSGVVRPSADLNRIGALDVATGATAKLYASSMQVLQMGKLKLAANARLDLTADKVSVETEASEIDTTARVVVNVLDSHEKDRVQLYADLSGATLPTFELSGEGASGQTVLTAGPFAFLSAGTTVAKQKKSEWTGLGETSNWSDSANWNGELPTAAAYFSGDTRTAIVNDGEARQFSRFLFYDTAGAYSFSGYPFTLTAVDTNSDNSAIRLASELPVAIYNTISMNSTVAKKPALSVVSGKGGFVALMGEVALTNRVLYFSGDVRIGGHLNCGSVAFAKTWTSKKATAMTVLNGAEVVATAQVAQEDGAGYRIRAGGTVDVRAGVWDWSAPVTNLVDGTLRLGAAFGGTTTPYFDGRGTIELQGSQLAGSSVGAVVVGSNTVTSVDDATLGQWTVAEGATLTLGASGRTYTLTKELDGDGRLAFVAGTRATLGGTLLEALERGEKVTVASAAQIDGELAWDDTQVKTWRETVGGKTVLRIRSRRGMAIMFH